MLDIYAYDDFGEQYVVYTADDDTTNPILALASPRETSVIQQKFFIRNDDATKFYTQVSLRWGPTDITVDSAKGIKYKLILQENTPTEAEWAAVASGNQIDCSDIGTESLASLDFIPFWSRLEVPRSLPSGIYEDAYLIIDYQENTVGA